MKKIFNGTPHSINIIDPSSVVFDEKNRKYVSANPIIVKTIMSDGLLNARLEKRTGEKINGEISTVTTKVVTVDNLPDGYDYYIVSALYLGAAKACGKDTGKFLTIGDPVYSVDGLKPMGTLTLQRN